MNIKMSHYLGQAGSAILIFFSLIFLFYICPLPGYAENLAENELIEVNLKLKGYFPSSDPEKDGLIFRQLGSIASDSDGRVALLDSLECRVYLFSPSGKLISSFGRRGQGPGEFSFPMKVDFYEDFIYVFDPTGRTLQFFKYDGSFIRLIKLFKSYSDVVIDGEGRLYCSLMMKRGAGPKLIDLLSDDGSLLFSFGDPEKIDDIPLGYTNEVKVLSMSQNSVFLGFITTGQVKTYDSQGRLLRNILDVRDYLKSEFDYNLKQFAKLDRGEKVGYRHLFESVKVFGKGIYFLRSTADRYELIEMNENLALTKRYLYKFKKSPENISLDFMVRESPDKDHLEFLLIELNPEAVRVIILTPEETR